MVVGRRIVDIHMAIVGRLEKADDPIDGRHGDGEAGEARGL